MHGFGLFGRIWVKKGPKRDEALMIGKGDGWMYLGTDRFTMLYRHCPLWDCSPKRAKGKTILENQKITILAKT